MDHPNELPAGQAPSVFQEDEQLTQFDREQYQRGIRKARNALFAAGILLFIGELFQLFTLQEELDSSGVGIVLGIAGVLLFIFIGLGLWTKRKPYTAILTGLLLYVGIHLLAAISDPSLLIKGLLVKGIIIYLLVSGMKQAKALQQLDRFSSGNY